MGFKNNSIEKRHVIFCEGMDEQQFSHMHKTKLHTYFSVNDKFVGMKLGEAARAKAFDWNSPRLDYLKSFLEEMKN